MQICRQLAGYSYARADNVRRAMSKKKASVMEAERADFVNGCSERNIPRDVAEAIFEEMVGFAQYAFNKSHATAYGIISYRTAYLKAHYPAEYFSALLTSVLENAVKIRQYIADAQKCGVSVLSPDINSSRETFSTDGKNIRYGLLAIRNVGKNFAESLIRERTRGNFKSFDEFVSRMINSDMNKRTAENMIKCGVFDSLGVTRNALVQCYESIIDAEHEKIRNNISGQMDLFSQASVSSASAGYKYPDAPEYSLKELLLLEKESSGMYFSGHMIDNYSSHVDRLSTDKISEIINSFADGNEDGDKYKDRSSVKVAGIISAKRTKIVKNGDTMAFITLEDRYGEIGVLIFARQYKQYADALPNEAAVLVTGTISKEEGEDPKILLSSVEPLKTNLEIESGAAENALKSDNGTQNPPEKRIYIKLPDLSDSRINTIYRIAALNRGNTSIVLYDSSTKKYSVMKGIGVMPSDKVLSRLSSVFSSENVIFR